MWSNERHVIGLYDPCPQEEHEDSEIISDT